MKFPKEVILCGKTFEVIFKESYDGGSFSIGEQNIKIGTQFNDAKIPFTDEQKLEIFIHECLELVLADRELRFVSDQGSVHFLMSHNEFHIICTDIVQVIKSLIELNKGGE